MLQGSGNPRATTAHNDKNSQNKEDARKLAQLIADGEIPFPQDRDARDCHHLAALVRARRRQRLIDYLAHLVARAIHDTNTHGRKRNNAEEEL